ncbi:hypothetical protein [Sphingomonas sp.]|uniref:hypothetical protein n=1 Tax=Sphingomonas sp. TaxID=28214 RepID=UPI003B00FFDF
MASNWLGLLVGAALDREDGGSGVMGAIEGTVIEGAVKLVTPLVVTFAIGWAVQYGLRRGLHAITGDEAYQGR